MFNLIYLLRVKFFYFIFEGKNNGFLFGWVFLLIVFLWFVFNMKKLLIKGNNMFFVIVVLVWVLLYVDWCLKLYISFVNFWFNLFFFVGLVSFVNFFFRILIVLFIRFFCWILLEIDLRIFRRSGDSNVNGIGGFCIRLILKV